MTCKDTRMSLLEPPTTYIYAVFFIPGCIVAIIGNILALIVLWIPNQRSRSNKILTFLALSDVLVGFVVFPITIYQVIFHDKLRDCKVDVIRVYSAVLLTGSSVLTLAVIAFDRYLLLTRPNFHSRKDVGYFTLFLVVLSWLIPGLSPLVRYINEKVYIAINTTIFVAPFFILLGCYVMIARAVRDQEKKLQKYQNSPTTLTNPLPQAFEPEIQLEVQSLSMSSNNDVSSTQKSNVKLQRCHIKVAKAVSILLIVYFICITPVNSWMIIGLINGKYPIISKFSLQNLYLFAMLTLCYNSFFNPIIYFWKNPEMKKGLRRLLRSVNIHLNSESSS